MKRIVINQEGLKGGELVRNYLDLTPRARIRLLDKIKSALPETNLSTRDQLETLHSKAQANLQTQKGLIPFQLNFDKKIFEEITSVTNDAIVALLDFIQKITDLRLEKVLNPISDNEVEEVLRDTTTTKEQKVQKLLERMGTQFHEPLTEDMSFTPLDIKLFGTYFSIDTGVARPRNLNELISGPYHFNLSQFGLYEVGLIDDDQRLLNGSFDNHATRASEFYEHPVNDEEIKEILKMQNDLVYQVVHNFDPKELSSQIAIKYTYGSINQNPQFFKACMDSVDDNPNKERRGRQYLKAYEYPTKPLYLGFSSIALILNRIRKANLAYIYGDTRFFLKREEAVK